MTVSRLEATLPPPSDSSTYTHGSPEEHWAAILRYDAARRQSSVAAVTYAAPNEAPAADTPRVYNKSMRSSKRMSVGDDLPPMPAKYEPPESGAYTRTKQHAPTDTPIDRLAHDDSLTLVREVTPPALNGENAVLVDRELRRLRERRPNAIRMRWRILTGSMMLLVVAFSVYVLTQCVRAYLSLSPATWFLSDAQDGTQQSPDPLLRTLALIEVAASGVALLGVLASGFYLRMTRRRSCGRHLIWFLAIITTTINVGLSLANIVLIAGWHKKYAATPNDPFAQTRDVALRCNGIWDLDILWSAAKSSMIAKPTSDDAASMGGCMRSPGPTLRMFLIAGGVRLAVFVVLCTLWLICLGRYNRVLHLQPTQDESMDESPEMHKLLAEEHGLPAMPMWKDAVPGAYNEDVDGDNEKRGSITNESRRSFGGDTLARMPEHHYSSRTLVEPAPRLDRFHWQRGASTQMHADDDDHSHTYGNLVPHGHHDRQHSAGWSGHVMDRLWGALWGGGGDGETRHEAVAMDEKHATALEDDGDLTARPSHPHALQWQHGRDGTRLGVRGWFGRDASGRASEELAAEEITAVVPHAMKQQVQAQHVLNASQEGRAQQGRHAASRRVQGRSGTHDPYTAGGSGSAMSTQERIEQRKQEQRDRIDFLAGFGTNAAATEINVSQTRRHSTSSGPDTLARMPELQAIVASHDDRYDEEGADEVDESAFWRRPSVSPSTSADGAYVHASKGPTFVRQLGKLVRKMSAIESVGSGGERSLRPSRTSREPSTASNLY